MKTSHAINTLIALAALLPSSIVGKKEKQTPHRIFRESSSKASKAKASKEEGLESFKEFLPKAIKAGKAKYHKEKIDLTYDDHDSGENWYIYDGGDYDNEQQDWYDEDHEGYEWSADAADEHWNNSNGSYYGHDEEGTSGGDVWEYGEEEEEEEEEEWHYSDDDWHDNWSLDYTYNDNYWYHDEALSDEELTSIMQWFLGFLSECSGIYLDFDSCIVNNVIVILASDDFMMDGRLRSLQADQNQQATSSYSNGDDWAQTCELPDEAIIQFLVKEAFQMCVESGVDLIDEEYYRGVEIFTRIFRNEECMCGYY